VAAAYHPDFFGEHFSLAVKGLLLVIERALDKTVSEG
jgi:hypothetical protein